MGEKARYVSLIMAGGSGTRFWPASTKSLPKQYLKLFGDRSLIQETVDRLLGLQEASDIFISSGKSQWQLLQEQLPEIKHLILEPVGRNTAPCLMLSVREFIKNGYSDDTVMGVFPADHHIQNRKAFHSILTKAIAFARQNPVLVTLGIVPTSPHTGYGYIETLEKAGDTPVKAKRFVEKPSVEIANNFLKAGSFYWNSGIFVWSIGAIRKAFELYLPDEWNKFLKATSQAALEEIFTQVKSQPIDTAILEKASNVHLLAAESLGWSDVGSWNALYDLRSDVGANVVVSGELESIETAGCLVNVPKGKLVALVGVKDLIVVECEDRILIVSREKDQLVRSIADLHSI